MKSFFRLLFVLATLGLSHLAFAEGEVSQGVGNIPTATLKLSTSEVRDVACDVLIKRGWRLTEKTDNKVVAYLKQRAYEAQVTLTLSKDAIEFSCWGYEINKAGERKKPEIPTRWLTFLKGDISTRLNQAASKKL